MTDLRKNHIYGIIICLLLLLGAGSFYIFNQKSEKHLEEISNNRLTDYTVNNAYAAEKELNNSLKLVETATLDFLDVGSLHSAKALKQLRILESNMPFSNLYIATKDGMAMNGSGIKLDLHQSSYFKRAILGESSIVQEDDGNNHAGNCLMINAPIIKEGKVIGTLHGEYDLFALSKIVEMQSFDGESYSIIIDGNGDYVLQSTSNKVINKEKENMWSFLENLNVNCSVPYAKLQMKLQKKEKGIVKFTKGNQSRRICYTPLGVNNWYLMKIVTDNQINQSTKAITDNLTLLTTIMILLCILMAAVIYSMINRVTKKKNKQIQAAYIQAERANVAKSQFLSSMSHEIRTPMNAIVGITTIAKEHVDEPNKTKEYLEKISNSSRVLLNIINDVLDMSAIESEKLKIAETPFDFKQVLSSISSMYYAQCRAKKVEFQMNLSKVTNEILVGDSLRVSQVLLNLLSNAFKFTEPGGEIKVSVIQMSELDDKVFMRFIVSDTGIGMEEDMIERLFQPFEQETASTAQKHGGSGLGLSIAKNLVDLMHGAIKVESQKGVGTTFTVDLPFGIASVEKRISSGKLESIHTLIIDHDKENVEYTAIILERIGVQYEKMESVESALERLRQAKESGEKIDICFVDWKNSEEDGISLIRKIREIVSMDETIIIVSAYDTVEVEDEAKEAGANLLVSKPMFQSSVFNALMSIHSENNVKQPIDAAQYDFTGHRVLLVEDNELNREIATELLDMVHLTVDTAENGQIAVEQFSQSKPGTYEVILMDMQMPVLDGLEATKQIRDLSHPQAATIPIYAMTANAFSEDVAAALSAGMNGHIAKPIDTDILYKTLDECLNKEEV